MEQGPFYPGVRQTGGFWSVNNDCHRMWQEGGLSKDVLYEIHEIFRKADLEALGGRAVAAFLTTVPPASNS